MTQELSQTALILLGVFSFAAGFCSGAFYDLFRIRRAAAKKKRQNLLTRIIQGFIIGLEDLVFFIMLGAVLSVLYHIFSYGRVRMIAVAALFSGFWLYRISIGRLVMCVADRVIAFAVMVKNILKLRIIKPMMSPAVRLINKISEKRKAKREERRELKEKKKYIARRRERLADPSRRANMLND